jgi:hypothetical protein
MPQGNQAGAARRRLGVVRQRPAPVAPPPRWEPTPEELRTAFGGDEQLQILVAKLRALGMVGDDEGEIANYFDLCDDLQRYESPDAWSQGVRDDTLEPAVEQAQTIPYEDSITLLPLRRGDVMRIAVYDGNGRRTHWRCISQKAMREWITADTFTSGTNYPRDPPTGRPFTRLEIRCILTPLNQPQLIDSLAFYFPQTFGAEELFDAVVKMDVDALRRLNTALPRANAQMAQLRDRTGLDRLTFGTDDKAFFAALQARPRVLDRLSPLWFGEGQRDREEVGVEVRAKDARCMLTLRVLFDLYRINETKNNLEALAISMVFYQATRTPNLIVSATKPAHFSARKHAEAFLKRLQVAARMNGQWAVNSANTYGMILLLQTPPPTPEELAMDRFVDDVNIVNERTGVRYEDVFGLRRLLSMAIRRADVDGFDQALWKYNTLMHPTPNFIWKLPLDPHRADDAGNDVAMLIDMLHEVWFGAYGVGKPLVTIPSLLDFNVSLLLQRVDMEWESKVFGDAELRRLMVASAQAGAWVTLATLYTIFVRVQEHGPDHYDVLFTIIDAVTDEELGDRNVNNDEVTRRQRAAEVVGITLDDMARATTERLGELDDETRDTMGRHLIQGNEGLLTSYDMEYRIRASDVTRLVDPDDRQRSSVFPKLAYVWIGRRPLTEPVDADADERYAKIIRWLARLIGVPKTTQAPGVYVQWAQNMVVTAATHGYHETFRTTVEEYHWTAAELDGIEQRLGSTVPATVWPMITGVLATARRQ